MLNTTRLQVPACIAAAQSPCSVNHYSTVKHEALAPEMSRLDYVALSAHAHTLRGWGEPTPAATAPAEALGSLPRALPFGTAAEVLVAPPAPRGSDMEEFDSEDFSTSEEDEDYVPSGERFG